MRCNTLDDPSCDWLQYPVVSGHNYSSFGPVHRFTGKSFASHRYIIFFRRFAFEFVSPLYRIIKFTRMNMHNKNCTLGIHYHCSFLVMNMPCDKHTRAFITDIQYFRNSTVQQPDNWKGWNLPTSRLFTPTSVNLSTAYLPSELINNRTDLPPSPEREWTATTEASSFSSLCTGRKPMSNLWYRKASIEFLMLLLYPILE